MFEKKQSDTASKTEKMIEEVSKLLPSSSEVLQQALEACQGIEGELNRAEVFSAIIPHLPESHPELIQQTLDAAGEIQYESNRAKVFSAIASQLSKPHTQLILNLWEATTKIQDEFFRAEVLRAIAPLLPESHLQQILETAIDFQYESDRVKVLSAIAPLLPKLPSQFLEVVLQAAINLKDEFFRAEVLSAIISQLPESQPYLLQTAFESINLINELDRIEALNEIVSQISLLPKSSQRTTILQKVLDAAKEMNVISNLAYALRVVAPWLPEPQRTTVLQQAVDAARSPLQSASGRVEALGAISPHLPEPQRTHVLQQALDATLNQDIFQNELDRVRMLSAIAPRLSESHPHLLQQALDAALNQDIFQDKSGCAEVLSAIVPQIPESSPHLNSALNAIRAIKPEPDRVEFWNAIVPRLSESQSNLLQQALEAAINFQDEPDRVRILNAIALWLSKSSQPKILEDALKVANNLQNKSDRFRILSSLSSCLPEPQRTTIFQQALNAATNFQSELDRAEALSAIVPSQPQLLQQALDAVINLESEPDRAKDLSQILQQALDAAINLESESDRAKALSGMIAWLPKSQPQPLQQALKTAINLKSKLDRAKVLSAIVPRLSESERSERLQETIDAIKTDKSEYTQAIALTNLVKQLFGFESKILKQALEITLLITNLEYRAIALSSITTLTFREDILAEVLEKSTVKETDIGLILSPILKFTEDKFLFRVLRSLNEQLPDELVLQFPKNQLSRALDFVEGKVEGGLEEDVKKTRFLSTLAPHLSIGLFVRALRLILLIKNEGYRADALCNLAPYIPEEQFSEAVMTAEKILSSSNQADALEGLIPYLPFDNLSRILSFVEEEINRKNAQRLSEKSKVLAKVATALASEQLMSTSLNIDQPSNNIANLVDTILNLIEQLLTYKYNGCEKDSVNILITLAPILSTIQFEKALNFVAQVADKLAEDEKSLYQDLLCKFASCIPDDDSSFKKFASSIDQLISKLGEIEQLIIKVYRRNWLEEGQNKKRLEEALNTTQEGANHKLNQLWLQVHVAKNSPADRQACVAAVNMIRGYDEHDEKIKALECLISHLPDSLRLEVAEIARALPADLRDDAPQNIESKGNEIKQKEKALKESKKKAEILKAKALISLACRFPEFRVEAKEAASSLENQVDKITQLGRLAVEVPERLLDIIDILEEVKLDFEVDKGRDTNLDSSSKTDVKELKGSNFNSGTLESYQQDLNKSRSLVLLKPKEQKDILTSLALHLPIHISREVKREGKVSSQLWKRAIKILSCGYRDALRVGNLRNDEAQDQDFLNLQGEINALSNLLLMRDLEPPMTVGILGGWGGGKSYIMHLMQTRMTEVRSSKIDPRTAAWNRDPNNEKLSPYVGHVYQIKFDAWTFAKADLWASFMQTIFFELDRQLTLEKQLTDVLKEVKDPAKNQDIENKIWSVLYKSSDADRDWLLKRVLKDEELLAKILGQATQGELWNTITNTQRQDRERLKYLQEQLEKSKTELNLKKAEIRQKTSEGFQSILEIQKNVHIRQVDALLGTSFELLRRRIGSQLFKELNNQIYRELYVKSTISESNEPSSEVQISDPSPVAVQEGEEENQGLLGNLDRILKEIEEKKKILEELQASDTNKIGKDSKKGDNHTENQDSETPEQIEKLLNDADAIRLNILDVATTVVEQNYGRVTLATLWRWITKNWIPLILVIFLPVIPLLLFVLYEINPAKSALGWTARLGSLITPILPTLVLFQNLLKSGASWFEEARLALTEYEKSVERKNKQREEWIEATVEQRVTEDKKLKQLEQQVSQLEQQVREQEALVPANQYATLADFVTGRIEAGTYKNHLGLMHQVKQDLLDLSNKLLPPNQYDPSFQNKIENLKKIFPRGPARVIVYIDDLDRCPPSRVVKVLEAVQLLVKTPLFIAVLAIDERYITRALEKFYEGVLSKRGHPSGTDYLEKIIQLPYRVRPIMANTLETYLRSQVLIQDSAAGGAKFSEFSRQEFNMLLRCCEQVDLSPRTLKRLTNIYKLFKIVCRTRGTQLDPNVQKAIMALLSLSGRYPDLMRGIFDNIEACFEEQRNLAKEKQSEHELHLNSLLQDVFTSYQLPLGDTYLEREWKKLKHDALDTNIIPAKLTLAALTHEIFNLIRSFSFVGDVGSNADDYRDIDIRTSKNTYSEKDKSEASTLKTSS